MATKRWIGSATAITQVDTVTVGGTWAGSDTITISIGSVELIITIGTGTTTANVAEAISNAINATSATDNLESDETRTIGGQELPEMTEFTASVNASVVTVTANTAGNPISGTQYPDGLSFSETSTSGTLTHTNDGTGSSIRPTGPNWFTDADNWSTATAPANNDVLIWSNSDIDCSHGLDAAVALTGLEYQIDSSYTGAIGLASRNANGYEEWRPKALDHGLATAAGNESTCRIGDGEGNGSSRIVLDFGATTPTAVINRSNTPESGARVAVSIIGGATGTKLNVNRGSVGFCEDGVSTGVCDLIMAYVTGQAGDAQVYVGRQGDVETVTKSGGILTMAQNESQTIDTFTQEPGDSGTTNIDGEVAVTTLVCNGGTVIYNSTGTITTPTLGGTGTLDFSRDNRTKTITNPVERNSAESTFLDPNNVITSLVLDYNNVKPSDTADDIGQNVRVTRGTVA